MPADARYFVETILSVKTVGKASKKASSFANSLTSAGDRIQRMGPSISGVFGRMSNLLALAGGAYGIGRVVSGAIKMNKEMEQANLGLATTLQLFGRNAGAADQFAANLAEAEAATDRLFEIAARSPASFGQAQELFRNMLPGIAQVEDSMDNILDFTTKALSVGTLLGGDFKQAGADLRRIFTGQAGGDVRAWAEGIGTAVQRAAGNMGGDVGFLAGLTGANLTKAFNDLEPEKRYQLLEEALADMDAATKAAGGTWDGLASAIKSYGLRLGLDFGKPLFNTIKAEMQGLFAKGGIFGEGTRTFKELRQAAKVAGGYLAMAGRKLFRFLVKGVQYFADNWEDIYRKLAKVFSTALTAAKTFAALRAAQTIGGAVVGGVGAGMGALGGFGKKAASIGKAMQAITTPFSILGPALITLVPLLLLFGAALAGLGVAFGGVVAWFISNWQDIITNIREGTYDLTPLANALALLWTKMVALGDAIMGGKGAAQASNVLTQVLLIAVRGIYFMIDTFEFFLRAAGFVQKAFNAITAGLKVVGIIFSNLIKSMLTKVRSALDIVPGARAARLSSSIGEAIKSLNNTSDSLWKSANADYLEKDDITKLADTFRDAIPEEGTLARDIEQGLEKALTTAATSSGSSSKRGVSPAKSINVRQIRVEMDLRNQDPDRIMGAFVRKLEKVTNQPTQAATQEEYGI